MNKNLFALIVGLSIIFSVAIISGAYKYKYKIEGLQVEKKLKFLADHILYGWNAIHGRRV